MKRKFLENIIVRFIRYVIDWRDTRSVIRELNKLSDKQLKDIGMNRGEIEHLIYRLQEESKPNEK